MRQQHRHMCLKERWGTFAFVVLMMLLCTAGAFYYSIHKQGIEMSSMIGIAIVCLIVAISLLCMNIRRKRIKKEFTGEFDKDIKKKEVICPRCGALMGASGICPKCGHSIR